MKNFGEKIKKNKLFIESTLNKLFSKNILAEKYSKATIEITIEIFELNCDILSYSIMATSLALTLANIEQKGLITCANLISINDEILADPILEEENQSSNQLFFGCIVDLQENNLFIQKGFIESEKLKKVIS